jgi:hypothetical protein
MRELRKRANARGERPPPTGTVERTRCRPIAVQRETDKRGGVSFPPICWENFSFFHFGDISLICSRIGRQTPVTQDKMHDEVVGMGLGHDYR